MYMLPSTSTGALFFKWIFLGTDFVLRYQCEEHFKLNYPIERNGYAQNMLPSMLSDERKHVRGLGLQRLLKAKWEQNNEVRKFVKPKLKIKPSIKYNSRKFEKLRTTNYVRCSCGTSRCGSIIIQLCRIPCHIKRHILIAFRINKCKKLLFVLYLPSTLLLIVDSLYLKYFWREDNPLFSEIFLLYYQHCRY